MKFVDEIVLGSKNNDKLLTKDKAIEMNILWLRDKHKIKIGIPQHLHLH